MLRRIRIVLNRLDLDGRQRRDVNRYWRQVRTTA